MTCPRCLESAKFVNYRPKQFVSLMGAIRFARAYYHCSHCGEGMIPWDQTLRMSPRCLTPAAEEVTTLAGIQESFGKAAEQTLPKLAGFRISESTVQRVTEKAGERLGDLLRQGKVLGGPASWKWNRDFSGKTCGYVSLDATGILMQGPGGSK